MRRKADKPTSLLADSGAIPEPTVESGRKKNTLYGVFLPHRHACGAFSVDSGKKGFSEMENAKNAANRASRFDIRAVAQVGILGGMAFLLMMVEIPLWFAPGFYKLDLSEIPVLIGGFAIGPLAGGMIELVKVVLYFFIHGSSTAGVGDFANFVIGCCMVVPAALIYKRRKTRRTAMLGLAAGTLLMTVAGSLANAYVLLPLFAGVMHLPLGTFVQMGTQVNPAITDLGTLILFAVVPFNLLKGVLVSVVTALLYKKVSPILHGTYRRP